MKNSYSNPKFPAITRINAGYCNSMYALNGREFFCYIEYNHKKTECLRGLRGFEFLKKYDEWRKNRGSGGEV